MRTLGLPVILAMLLAGSTAHADTRREVIQWDHGNPGAVESFRIHYGLASGSYTETVDVPQWFTSVDGHFFTIINVPIADTIYVAMTAHAGGVSSPYSNEKVRVGSGAPTPVPPPTAGGASAGIVGFELWDAQSGTQLDANLSDGATIDVGAHPCTTIQVATNAYLTGSGVFGAGDPGSVRFDFDGSNPDGTCWLAGTSHQNEPPYVWESKTLTGAFECAASLAEVGTHTLTVTPFDGDECTGAQGPATSVTFTVVAGTPTTTPPPEPEPEPLGVPGRPTLISQ